MEGVNVKKGSYSGTYGINAQWTVWNGGQNTNALKQNTLAEQQADLSAQETANSIELTAKKPFIILFIILAS
jgi:outer membrane protein